MLLEHVAYQATALADAQLALTRGGSDAGGVLAAMLQYRECVVETLIDRTGADHADDAAHDVSSSDPRVPIPRFRVPLVLRPDQRAQAICHGFPIGDQQ